MAQQTQSHKKSATKKAVLTGPVATQKPEGAVSEERHRMIAETAYRIAEQRGFEGDMAMDDWLQAEAEVNAQFEAKH